MGNSESVNLQNDSISPSPPTESESENDFPVDKDSIPSTPPVYPYYKTCNIYEQLKDFQCGSNELGGDSAAIESKSSDQKMNADEHQSFNADWEMGNCDLTLTPSKYKLYYNPSTSTLRGHEPYNPFRPSNMHRGPHSSSRGRHLYFEGGPSQNYANRRALTVPPITDSPFDKDYDSQRPLSAFTPYRHNEGNDSDADDTESVEMLYTSGQHPCLSISPFPIQPEFQIRPGEYSGAAGVRDKGDGHTGIHSFSGTIKLAPPNQQYPNSNAHNTSSSYAQRDAGAPIQLITGQNPEAINSYAINEQDLVPLAENLPFEHQQPIDYEVANVFPHGNKNLMLNATPPPIAISPVSGTSNPDSKYSNMVGKTFQGMRPEEELYIMGNHWKDQYIKNDYYSNHNEDPNSPSNGQNISSKTQRFPMTRNETMVQYFEVEPMAMASSGFESLPGSDLNKPTTSSPDITATEQIQKNRVRFKAAPVTQGSSSPNVRYCEKPTPSNESLKGVMVTQPANLSNNNESSTSVTFGLFNAKSLVENACEGQKMITDFIETYISPMFDQSTVGPPAPPACNPPPVIDDSNPRSTFSSLFVAPETFESNILNHSKQPQNMGESSQVAYKVSEENFAHASARGHRVPFNTHASEYYPPDNKKIRLDEPQIVQDRSLNDHKIIPLEHTLAPYADHHSLASSGNYQNWHPYNPGPREDVGVQARAHQSSVGTASLKIPPHLTAALLNALDSSAQLKVHTIEPEAFVYQNTLHHDSVNAREFETHGHSSNYISTPMGNIIQYDLNKNDAPTYDKPGRPSELPPNKSPPAINNNPPETNNNPPDTNKNNSPDTNNINPPNTTNNPPIESGPVDLTKVEVTYNDLCRNILAYLGIPTDFWTWWRHRTENLYTELNIWFALFGGMSFVFFIYQCITKRGQLTLNSPPVPASVPIAVPGAVPLLKTFPQTPVTFTSYQKWLPKKVPKN